MIKFVSKSICKKESEGEISGFWAPGPPPGTPPRTPSWDPPRGPPPGPPPGAPARPRAGPKMPLFGPPGDPPRKPPFSGIRDPGFGPQTPPGVRPRKVGPGSPPPRPPRRGQKGPFWPPSQDPLLGPLLDPQIPAPESATLARIWGPKRGAAGLLINVFFGSVLVCFFCARRCVSGGFLGAEKGGFRGGPRGVILGVQNGGLGVQIPGETQDVVANFISYNIKS